MDKLEINNKNNIIPGDKYHIYLQPFAWCLWGFFILSGGDNQWKSQNKITGISYRQN